MSVFRNIADWINQAPHGAPSNLRRVYGLARVGFPLAFLMHVLFFVVFWHLDQCFLAIFNIFSIAVFAWCTWCALNLRDLKTPTIWGLLIELQLHAALATVFLGIEPFFFSYLLYPIIVSPLVPYFERKIRIALSLFSVVLLIALGATALAMEPIQPLPAVWNLIFFMFNAPPAILFVWLAAANFELLTAKAEEALAREHARSEALLYNLLPEEIAARLKVAPGKTIADNLDHTAILFADIVGFTPRSARMAPDELVEFLNRIFSAFDTLAAKHGLEKIKTIGDAYMVAAGLPQPVDRPVHRVAEMAFDMLEAMRAFSDEIGEEIEIRIGLHAGPVVAGVIGQQKLFYDVWGDTVNTASRMESHGQAGRIQVTAAAREALEGDYGFEPRGVVEIKGIGEIETWWLTQNASAPAKA